MNLNKNIFQLSIGFRRLHYEISLFFLLGGIVGIYSFIKEYQSMSFFLICFAGVFIIYALILGFKLYTLTRYIYIIDEESITLQSINNKHKLIKIRWDNIHYIKNLDNLHSIKSIKELKGFFCTVPALFSDSESFIPLYPTKNDEQFKEVIRTHIRKANPQIEVKF